MILQDFREGGFFGEEFSPWFLSGPFKNPRLYLARVLLDFITRKEHGLQGVTYRLENAESRHKSRHTLVESVAFQCELPTSIREEEGERGDGQVFFQELLGFLNEGVIQGFKRRWLHESTNLLR